FINGDLVEQPDSLEGWFQLKTRGSLIIAGRKNIINMIVRAKKIDDNRFNVVGSKELSMFDYDVIPPTAFFGLIKADDRLVIHFDLIVSEIQRVPDSVY